MSNNGKWATLIFSALLGSMLALEGWTLTRIDHNSTTLASVSAIVDSGKRERLDMMAKNDDAHQSILMKIDQLVNRREFDVRSAVVDSKFLSVEVEIREAQSRITKIEAQLVGLDTRFVSIEMQLKELKAKVEALKNGK